MTLESENPEQNNSMDGVQSIRIAIVGRPNVGKSSLFNRLFGRRRAIVHDYSGVTRDRLVEKTEWIVHGKTVSIELVDTGGIGGKQFEQEVDQQVELAMAAADVILVVFDAQQGWTHADQRVLDKLRQLGVFEQLAVLGVVNKVDQDQHEDLFSDFFASGIPDLLTVSAEHNRGMDEVQEWVVKNAPSLPAEILQAEEDLDLEDEERVPRLAIVGRPNVGKSTLTNALLNEKRMITSPKAGTTVDSIDSLVTLGGQPYLLIDTAGIRRKSKTDQGVEVLSVIQAKKALERTDIALLLIDGDEGVTDQDAKIAGIVEECGKSVILVVNKWDLQRENEHFSEKDAVKLLHKEMGFLKYAPILFVSALEKKGLRQISKVAQDILEQKKVKLETRDLTDWARKEVEVHNPKNAKIYYAHQVSRHPPTIAIYVNHPEKIHFSLKRYLLNSLRKNWGFFGTPVRLKFIKSFNQGRKKTTK